MNNKIYNILFESKLNPGRMGLISIPAEDSGQALHNSLIHINQQLGDFGWQPKLTTIIILDIPPQQPVVSSVIEVEKDKNFLLKCILDNKDEELLKVATKYLMNNEVKYIQEQWKSK